jgi:hypothetical protein
MPARSRRHRPEAGVMIDRDRYHGRVTDPRAGASWQFVPQAAWRRGSPRRFGPVARCLAAATAVSLAVAVAVWWVAPARPGLGGGSVRYFAGTAKVLVDPQALAHGEVSAAVRRDALVTARRTVRTLATDGDVAQVRDTWLLRADDGDWTRASEIEEEHGRELARVETLYAIDRTSLAAASAHPAGWQVADHRGLVLDWPNGAAKKDYVGWVNDTKSTTALRFVRPDRHRVCRYVSSSPVPCTELDVFVYRSTVDSAPVADERTLAALPRSLPAATVSALAANLLPAQSKRQLDQALTPWAGPVPLDYTYQATATYRVEPVTGIVVGVEREEIRTMHVRLPGRVVTPAIVIHDVTLKMTCAADNCAGVDVWDFQDRARLWGTTVPVVLIIASTVGAMATAGAVLVRRRRRNDEPYQMMFLPGSPYPHVPLPPEPGSNNRRRSTR